MELNQYLSKGRIKGHLWTPEDERKLFEMAKKKTPIDKVYAEFKGRSVSAIKNKIVKLHLSRRNDVLQIG